MLTAAAESSEPGLDLLRRLLGWVADHHPGRDPHHGPGDAYFGAEGTEFLDERRRPLRMQ